MKLERLTKKVGEDMVKIETFTGRDWQGKRFYLDAPKGAYVDYKSGKYFKSSHDKSGYKLNEWFDSWGQKGAFKIMYRLIND